MKEKTANPGRALADTEKDNERRASPTLPGGASFPPPDRGSIPPVGGMLKHYEIIRELAQGGFGSVCLARDTKLARLVAIKFLRDPDGKAAARLEAEARATAKCIHENIVVIHDVDKYKGWPYMVLEYIEGCTLRDFIQQQATPASPG